MIIKTPIFCLILVEATTAVLILWMSIFTAVILPMTIMITVRFAVFMFFIFRPLVTTLLIITISRLGVADLTTLRAEVSPILNTNIL